MVYSPDPVVCDIVQADCCPFALVVIVPLEATRPQAHGAVDTATLLICKALVALIIDAVIFP